MSGEVELGRVFSSDVVLVPLRASSDDDALRQLVERVVAAAGLEAPEQATMYVTTGA